MEIETVNFWTETEMDSISNDWDDLLMTKSKLVVIESPYSGSMMEIKENLAYLEYAIRDCLKRGEYPIASHKLYTLALDDNNPEERELGIKAGFEWGKHAGKIVFYMNRGESNGMKKAREYWISMGKTIEDRII